MPLLVQRVSKGVNSFADLLVLLVRQHALNTPGSSGTLFHDIPGMLPRSDRGPWVRGHYSFVWGHLMSSIVFVEGDLVLSGRRISCFHSKTDGSVWHFGTGFVVHGPSTG